MAGCEASLALQGRCSSLWEVEGLFGKRLRLLQSGCINPSHLPAETMESYVLHLYLGKREVGNAFQLNETFCRRITLLFL